MSWQGKQSLKLRLLSMTTPICNCAKLKILREEAVANSMDFFIHGHEVQFSLVDVRSNVIVVTGRQVVCVK